MCCAPPVEPVPTQWHTPTGGNELSDVGGVIEIFSSLLIYCIIFLPIPPYGGVIGFCIAASITFRSSNRNISFGFTTILPSLELIVAKGARLKLSPISLVGPIFVSVPFLLAALSLISSPVARILSYRKNS